MEKDNTNDVDAESIGLFPSQGAAAIRRARDKIFSKGMMATRDPLELCGEYSSLIDDSLAAIFDSALEKMKLKRRVSLFAMGGYGRSEMGLHSDIDIMLLHDGVSENEISELNQILIYPFWDNSFEIGGAARTLSECEEIASKDPRTLSSLLDYRFLSGTLSDVDSLTAMLKRYFSNRDNLTRYFDDKIAEQQERFRRYGDSIFLLQPQIKDGEGGLREYQTVFWLSKALDITEGSNSTGASLFINEKKRMRVSNAVRYIWKVRNALHFVEGGKRDRLVDSIQKDVAEILGYRSDSSMSSAERMMTEYYRSASEIHSGALSAVEKIRHHIKPPGVFQKLFFRRDLGGGLLLTPFKTISVDKKTGFDSSTMFYRILREIKKRGLPLSSETMAFFEDEMETLRASTFDERSIQILRELLSDFKNASALLWIMQQSGFLSMCFPEMHDVFHTIQHDGFHIYTTGTHSLKAVQALENLWSCKNPSRAQKIAISHIKRPYVLLLSVLLHDVGKGLGGDHSAKGAKIARRIVNGLGYGEDVAADVEFLVGSHLLFSTLAFKRDMNDPSMIARFAETIRSEELLSMLYLLTYADIVAIGPSVWNSWKANLMDILYNKTLDRLSKGEGAVLNEEKLLQSKIRSVESALGGISARAELKKHLDSLPRRYIFACSADAIAAHMLLQTELESSKLATSFRELPTKNISELTIITKDKTGLFADIAGVLSAHGCSIADAQIYTTQDGTAIDIIHIFDPSGEKSVPVERSYLIRESLDRILSGELKVEDIALAFQPGGLMSKRRRREPEIEFDNDVSATESVLEIHADDRVGLLYSMALVFRKLGFTIDRAIISTHVDRVIDVFYLRDGVGGKIEGKKSSELIELLKGVV